jgi:hypothetical protein
MKNEGTDEAFNQVASIWENIYNLEVLAIDGDYESVHNQAVALDESLKKIVPKSAITRNMRTAALRQDHKWIIESALRTGRHEEGVTTARDLVDQPLVTPTDEKIFVDAVAARSRTYLGQARIASGEAAAARAPLAEALAYYRARQAHGASDTTFRQDFGKALYEESRIQNTDPAGRAQRRALLDEAQSVLGGLSQEAQQLRDSRELIAEVSVARSNPGE